MDTENAIDPSIDKIFNSELSGDDEEITLEQISLLTDFPEDFIKKELLIEKNEISMKDFRLKVLEYLEKTIQLDPTIAD